jgi:hypothetical protein
VQLSLKKKKPLNLEKLPIVEGRHGYKLTGK